MTAIVETALIERSDGFYAQFHDKANRGVHEVGPFPTMEAAEQAANKILQGLMDRVRGEGGSAVRTTWKDTRKQ